MEKTKVKPHVSGDLNSFKITGEGAANNPHESEQLLKHIQKLLDKYPLKKK